jgi:hypothetical protein
MSECTLWFGRSEVDGPCQLERTHFKGNPFDNEAFAVRGKTAGVYQNAGTFQWTPGVKALCIVFLNAILRHVKKEKNYLCVLQGGKGSLASSLDYALNKQPDWLFDTFGADQQGNSYLRHLLLRSNSGRRQGGPVRISLNEQLLSPRAIKIYVEDALITEPGELEQLARSILESSVSNGDGHASTRYDFSVNASASEITPDLKPSFENPPQLSGFDEPTHLSGFDEFFPAITPVTDEDIDKIYSYECETFPTDHATKQRLLEWRRHDPSNFMCIRDTAGSFMAYYLVFFPKPQALKDYLAGHLAEDDIRASDLVEPLPEMYSKQEVIHLCVFASRLHASLFTVDLLWHLVGRFLKLATSGRLSTIYAEASTSEGQLMLLRFGFKRMSMRHKGTPMFELNISPSVIKEWDRRYVLRTFCRQPVVVSPNFYSVP